MLRPVRLSVTSLTAPRDTPLLGMDVMEQMTHVPLQTYTPRMAPLVRKVMIEKVEQLVARGILERSTGGGKYNNATRLILKPNQTEYSLPTTRLITDFTMLNRQIHDAPWIVPEHWNW
eukprot:GHVO01062941.1.p1 GENE.GHVO01062941.1~~GHVO01062941.1.p1  ORF type:complete len:118 (-),score=2.14 GHVO01062941.1:352-705(-)